ncbi:hypothetical protein PF001_g22012 [Phytophthora fragariae]|uniref:Autophagy-related protein 16 domain-containing protein n=1 Tax=Phytophthora fragariae TaxID=53985 RepID=A0A6A3ISG5_9STRA|nr:hypothetical protein PF009_g28753 [Phytophthora fragariae]KAE8982403.1 hypothetical protein PF011_g21633 [Phytophthora fragariae]KAE9191468.1 hypothetical protein PF004_g21596 [Phytophthora fragariae]KAE9285220.1 hypothetical protein PF001_g22012 [Phytophthora fragariae]
MSSHRPDHSDGDRSPPPSPRSARSTTSRRSTRAPRPPAGEIARLEQELRSTQATRATLFRDRDRLNDIVNRLNTELQDLERHRWGQEDEIRRLRTEIDDLQRASNGGSTQLIQDLRLQVDQQAAKIHDVNRRLARADQRLLAAEEDRDRLDRELDQSVEEAVQLRSQLDDQTHELQWTQDELATAVRSLDRVTTALQNSEAELDQERSTSGGSAPLAPTSSAPVPAASGSAWTSVTRLSKKLRQARRDLASLQAARNVSTARVVQLEGDNRQLRDEISQLNQGQATLATENSDLRARLTDARRDICALEAQLSDVQDAYAGLRRVNDETEEGLEDVSTALSRVVEWIHLRHAAGAATPSSSAAEVATPSSSAAGAATPSSSAAGAAAPLSSTSTTPTGKRARDRSASPTLGPSSLKRAGSVSSQLPPSRSRSPSPALSLSSDEEIDQGPGGPGVLAPQEVIEIHDDGAGSESDHAGPEADQAPPVGGKAGSGTPPGSGGSPDSLPI